MASRAQTLIILGAGGDLTRRLLLPGLAGVIVRDAQLDLELIGAGHGDHDDAAWRSIVREALDGGLRELPDAGERAADSAVHDRLSRAVERARWVAADATDRRELAALLAEAAHDPVVYFALPPQVTLAAVEALEPADLPAGTRFALEKPFGADGDEAELLNGVLARLLPETRIFRVDHFLGESTVLNLLGLRFANRLIESVWSADHVSRIDIVYDETLALEGRAGYYDRAGALVDMIQSHLLLVAGLVVMEPPRAIERDALHDELVDALSALSVRHGDPVRSSRRARYTAGDGPNGPVPAYVDEDGVEPDRATETLAELAVTADSARWKDVPITLRSGKAIGRPATTITLTLKPVEHLPGGFAPVDGAPRITIALTPERVAVELDLNGPGDPLDLERVTLDTTYGAGDLSAYGEVLDRVLIGEQLLAVPAEAAVLCWRLVEPVLAAWRSDRVPLEEYPAGSPGPASWSVPLAADE